MSLFKKDRVREQCAAPSFSLTKGEVFSVSTPKELKEILSKGSFSVLFYLSENAEDLNGWAKALSFSVFAVILDNSSVSSRFCKVLNRLVFSPVPKKITGAFLAGSEADAEKVFSSLLPDSSIITVFTR